MQKRIEWIDWGKALAIFLMVLLHVHCDNTLDSYISGCRLPFFFIVSGFLFRYENNPDGKKFFTKRFRQLVVPYLWINILAYILWVFILRHYGENTADTLEWHTPLIGIFTGVGPLLVHDIPTWSLLCFFVVEVVFYFLVKIECKWWWVCIGSMALFCVLVTTIPEYIGNFPLVIGPSIAGLIFYSFGFGLRNSLFKNYLIPDENYKISIWHYLILLLGLIIYIPAVYYNGTISFYICRVGNLPYFFLSSFSGACIVIVFFLILSKYVRTNRLIRMMSVGTLIICGFHLMIFSIMKGVGLFIFGIDPSQLTTGIGNGILFALTATLLTLPIIWFIRKYARPLVDK